MVAEAAFRHTPLCPAGHLPRKGGDQMSPRLSRIFNAAELGERPRLPISPLAGEMSGRTEGGVKE
ncbi:lytic murein transglycosylase [Mesorhizobium sp. WSM3876]|nr:lytic murein transglycosylase [Mesorhizobium sp. WSM3876]